MGPVPPPYHGQSVAFSTVINKLQEDKNNKCTIINLSGNNTILRGIMLCIKIIYLLLFFKYDVVYFTCSRSFFGSLRDIILLFCCRLKSFYVVNHLHGSDFKSFYKHQTYIYKKIIQKAYKGVTTSIVLLEKMKDQFEAFPTMDIKVISNGYSSSLDSLPISKPLKRDSLNIIYLSNIMKTKGILYLLEAIDNIMESNNIDITLHVAGKFIGDDEASAKTIELEFFKLYDNLKTKYGDRVKYLDILTGDLKKKYLWNSDIFILPTYYKTEAFPISILEAMRAGNYIISTNHNYIPDIISDKNGDLIKPNSIESIINSINKVIKNLDHMNSIQKYNITQAISCYTEKAYFDNILKILYNRN
jgi:glycosyltransferase involved in cell wall biosynthesis